MIKGSKHTLTLQNESVLSRGKSQQIGTGIAKRIFSKPLTMIDVKRQVEQKKAEAKKA